MSSDCEFLCEALNEVEVFFDPVGLHTSTHFLDAPKLRDLVIEVLSNRALNKDIEAFDVDMDRIVGVSDVVTVDENDEIVYAMRPKRVDQGYVPFTKSRPTEPESWVTCYLVRQDDGTYDLSSAWIGRLDSPPFPQMANANADSIPFWSKHAFVWDSQKIIPSTEIPDCPW